MFATEMTYKIGLKKLSVKMAMSEVLREMLLGLQKETNKDYYKLVGQIYYIK